MLAIREGTDPLNNGNGSVKRKNLLFAQPVSIRPKDRTRPEFRVIKRATVWGRCHQAAHYYSSWFTPQRRYRPALVHPKRALIEDLGSVGRKSTHKLVGLVVGQLQWLPT